MSLLGACDGWRFSPQAQDISYTYVPYWTGPIAELQDGTTFGPFVQVRSGCPGVAWSRGTRGRARGAVNGLQPDTADTHSTYHASNHTAHARTYTHTHTHTRTNGTNGTKHGTTAYAYSSTKQTRNLWTRVRRWWR